MTGIDVPGSTFLLQDAVLSGGVVFAFSAFFRENTPMRFQIWRPESPEEDERDFTLIAEIPYQASRRLAKEDVSIRIL